MLVVLYLCLMRGILFAVSLSVFREVMRDESVVFLTIMRDPSEAFLSAYNYYRIAEKTGKSANEFVAE